MLILVSGCYQEFNCNPNKKLIAADLFKLQTIDSILIRTPPCPEKQVHLSHKRYQDASIET